MILALTSWPAIDIGVAVVQVGSIGARGTPWARCHAHRSYTPRVRFIRPDKHVTVEGSEYAFLENAIDTGDCALVNQITLEWHHYEFDNRYGGGSSPHINAIVAMLRRCGLQQFHVYDPRGGWPNTDKLYNDMGMTLRYNLAAFMRP